MITTKLVNVYPLTPIVTVNPPLRSIAKRVTFTIPQIRSCLMARATVEEILPNGDVVTLNISNYDKVITCKEDLIEPVEVVEPEPIKVDTDAVWKAAYESELSLIDMNNMTRKQRRSAIAQAKAHADNAVRIALKEAGLLEEEAVEEEEEIVPVMAAEPVIEEAPVVEEEVVVADAEEVLS